MMPQGNRIPVSLNQAQVQSMLNALLQGAKHKTLRVVAGSDGCFHIESKDLRITFSTGGPGSGMYSFLVMNEKQSAMITTEDLQEMKLNKLASDVEKELIDKYSPYSHHLADSLGAFSRQYGSV